MVSPTPPAPLEIRNAAYRKLLELSPAWRYERELVTAHPDGLLARGLLPKDVPRFGALPPQVKERDELARRISDFIEEQFPAYTQEHSPPGVIGVPGFWEGSLGEPKLGKDFDYKRPALVIPYRNGEGLIKRASYASPGRKVITTGFQPPKTGWIENRRAFRAAAPFTGLFWRANWMNPTSCRC